MDDIREIFNQKALQRRSLSSNGKAIYSGYDADREAHATDRGDVRQVLANSGLAAGDAVDWQEGAIDFMPRSTQPEELPQLGLEESFWAVLLRKRAYLRTRNEFRPAVEAEFSDPVPARWLMTYYSGRYTLPAAVENRVTTGERRYTIAGSIMCPTSGFGIPDSAYYCTYGFRGGWDQVPDRFIEPALSPLPGRCAFGLWLGSGFGSGLVIGAIVPSPDGIESIPSAPPYPLPEVYSRQFVSETQEWLPCSAGPGPLIDMEWTPLDILPFSPYVPAQLIRPAQPAGIYPIDDFETQVWLLTPQGAVKVLSIPDVLDAEDDRYVQQSVSAWLSVDEQLVARVDVQTIDPLTVPPVVESQYFRVQSLAVSESEVATSWRFVSGQSDPCSIIYKLDPRVNIYSIERRFSRLVELPSIAGLRAGTSLAADFWGLPSGSCSINLLQPQRRQSQQVGPQNLDELLSIHPKDQLSVLGAAIYA